jgi:hypothetical protein
MHCKSVGSKPGSVRLIAQWSLVFGPGAIAEAHTADEGIGVEEILQARRILDSLLFTRSSMGRRSGRLL